MLALHYTGEETSRLIDLLSGAKVIDLDTSEYLDQFLDPTGLGSHGLVIYDQYLISM